MIARKVATVSVFMGGWVYNGGAVGLLREGHIHITDKPPGNKELLKDWFKNLPAGWEEPDAAYGTYVSSNAVAFIKGDKVWVTDWESPRLLSSFFPNLPKAWASGGIKGAWIYGDSGGVGLWRGNEVHITNKNPGNTTLITEFFPNLPAGWDAADTAYGNYGSGMTGFIKGNQVWVTDWPKPKLLGDQWPDLPSDWKQ
ncbi:hypothetical protein [Streptomyces sp. NPDC002530]